MLSSHLAFTETKDKPEGLSGKANSKKSTLLVITPELKKKMPALISILEGEMSIKWEKVNRTFILSDIKDFAAEVTELGKKYGIQIISGWAEERFNLADAFDMGKLPGSLKYYPELIKEIKKYIGRVESKMSL